MQVIGGHMTIKNALPPKPVPKRVTNNTFIWEALNNRIVGEWVEVGEYETRHQARVRQGNLLGVVKLWKPLGAGYGITTAIRLTYYGTWTLSISKVVKA